MTHLQVRKFLTSLLCLAMLFAFVKLAIQDDWYSIVLALSGFVGVILTWAVTKENEKKGES